MLVKSVGQAQVEGKEERKEEAISAQCGHHPQHRKQLHTYRVAQVREESQSLGRLQGQRLTKSQHMIVHLGAGDRVEMESRPFAMQPPALPFLLFRHRKYPQWPGALPSSLVPEPAPVGAGF